MGGTMRGAWAGRAWGPHGFVGTRLGGAVVFTALVGTAFGALSGCRVAEGDVKRWETTQRGPHKLVAVITHDKYDWGLRTEAALALIRMPPRGGVRQGIKFLIEKYKDEEGQERDGALVQLDDESRKQIVDRMSVELVKQLQPPPPARTPEGRLPADLTVPYKDATFAMLVHEPPLVANEKTKAELKTALIKWSQTGFDDRVENGSQQFGLEQMMRYLGPESVKTLPSIISDNTGRIDRIANLVKDIGDPETKLELSKAFVQLAEKYNSKEWLDAQTKIVQEHNKKNNTAADEKQVAAQVDKIQEKRLTEEVFPAMKKSAGRPSVDYLFKYAGDGSKPPERRKLALAALEGNVDKNSKDDLEKIFKIAANDDTADPVRDVAFQRMGEFPKDWIVPKLWTLNDPKKWKVRWVAFELALKTMTPKQIPEFMSHLPKVPAVKMGMTEPLSYAKVMKAMEVPSGEPKPRDTLNAYLGTKDLGPKLTALGYYWEGPKADKGVVQPYSEDLTPLPKCEEADECSWQCDVPKPDNPKETVPKKLATVGEFVKFCLLPSMEK
jgi:hypothetical protein